MKKTSFLFSLLISVTAVACDDSGETKLINLEEISLPKGFKISIFAEDVPNARSLAIGQSGTIFVGNRSRNRVYALKDTDGDGIADRRWIIAKGLRMPNGVAFFNGDLFVAEVSKIWRFPNIEENLENPQSELVYEDYPTDGHHGWKYIAFGPDGKLYVPVGAPCNICDPEEPVYASITRMNPDGSELQIYAHGVRNSVGFDWHPETGELWFTDNGRDWMGDNRPPCELNIVSEPGQHFGYPYCHGEDISDPEFGERYPCEKFTPPQWGFAAHTAPLGMIFYTGDMFPEKYRNQIFVAQHGSWNRSKKIGYRVMAVFLKGNQAVDAEIFARGWLDKQEQEAWGRPVDLLQLPDGSILLSDDQAGLIYRITYQED